MNLNFIHRHIETAIKVLPINYVKDTELHSNIFNFKNTSGVISSVYTSFFIDHIEPLKALIWVQKGLDWPLKELFNGYRFLLILEARRRNRVRFQSALQQTVL